MPDICYKNAFPCGKTVIWERITDELDLRFKDGCTIFWKDRPAGNVSFIIRPRKWHSIWYRLSLPLLLWDTKILYNRYGRVNVNRITPVRHTSRTNALWYVSSFLHFSSWSKIGVRTNRDVAYAIVYSYLCVNAYGMRTRLRDEDGNCNRHFWNTFNFNCCPLYYRSREQTNPSRSLNENVLKMTEFVEIKIQKTRGGLYLTWKMCRSRCRYTVRYALRLLSAR